MNKKTIDILLVEDNPADAILVQKIFESSEASCSITVAQDGEIAMSMLRDNNTTKPDIILLDINMPKKDGKSVLRDIKMSDDLKHIPVIMLSSSLASKEVMECYALYASSYVIKPANINDHKKLLAAFDAFWFDFAVFPEKSH